LFRKLSARFHRADDRYQHRQDTDDAEERADLASPGASPAGQQNHGGNEDQGIAEFRSEHGCGQNESSGRLHKGEQTECSEAEPCEQSKRLRHALARSLSPEAP
jgi:hypothetical protein